MSSSIRPRMRRVDASMASRSKVLLNFDLSSSKLTVDHREDYGEERYRAVGFLDAKLYVLIFTVRKDKLRAISLRRAKREEAEDYAEGR